MRFRMGKLARSNAEGDLPQDKGGMACGRGRDAAATQPKVPTRSILSKEFVYRDSAHTDIAATFNRIRREQRKEAEAQREADTKLRTAVVRVMKPKKTGNE